MGTVALLAATKALSQSPPKRSILVMAVTGEELGLLGSQYYADHPIIPLQKIVYNLNTDGAGYNSTEHLSETGVIPNFSFWNDSCFFFPYPGIIPSLGSN
jgi:Zn-dependent M28 family amino/carboxypeptidase